MVSQQDAAAELLSRREARKSLVGFTQYTKPDFQVGDHHRQIAEALEAVERGECDRLMIFAPPRHTKSELASRRFPAWYLGRHPDRQLIAATYSGDFALDFGRDVRSIVQSERFAALYPDVALRPDSKAANVWRTNHDGVSVYVGVGGPITGRGAHCFVAGTLIDTTNGKVRIEELKHCPASVKILSYGNKRIEAKALQAFSERQGYGIYRITTSHGRVVEATSDHPFFVAGRYIEASQLAAGDPLLCVVRKSFCAAGLRDAQGADEELLGRVLFGEVLQCAPGNEVPPKVRQVLGAGRKEDAEVLRAMPRDSEYRPRQMAANWQDLPHVQRAIRGAAPRQWAICRVLQQAMLRARALAAHVWRWQSKVQGWGNTLAKAAALSKGVQDRPSENSKERQPSLCGMRRCGIKIGSASSRQLADEQCGVQSGHALLSLSQQVARGEGWEVEGDFVAMVERVRETATVYDIQVADNHNFFAGGVLVHNCALIDDPFKNREEADSEARRETVWKWYTSTLRTRLMPGGAIVLVCTRWHDDDLAGRLLAKQPDEWRVVELQAISNEGSDRERALWPGWYDLAALKRIKADIGIRDWSALYQQRPTAQEGTFFKREWFKRYTPAQLPTSLHKYLTTDHAPAGEVDSDYTCARIWGVDPHVDLYLMDGFRHQETLDKTADKLIGNKVAIEHGLRDKGTPEIGGLIKRHKPFCWFPEDDNNWKSAAGFIRTQMRQEKVFCRIEPISPHGGDKQVKAQPFQAMAASGRVWIPVGPMGDDVIEQYLKFPAGKNDDEIDSAAIMGRALDMAHPAIAQREEPKKQRDSWDRAFSGNDDDNDWKTA